MTFKTRFAPSPTGELHLGHAYSALFGFDLASINSGIFHLRIEDLDQSRSTKAFEKAIYEDLSWLDIKWNENIIRQSERSSLYNDKLKTLWDLGLLYECSCSRRDILNAISAPHGNKPRYGPDGSIYPGTCKKNITKSRFPTKRNGALRLDMKKAWNYIDRDFLTFFEAEKILKGTSKTQIVTRAEAVNNIGDVVLSRPGSEASYHLSVVIDDAELGINNIVRGEDLFDATKIHTILYFLFNFSNPTYYHHKLITDSNGKRLAKRDKSRSISSLRKAGHTPKSIRSKLGI